jgi:hypothetical protein
MVNQEFLKQKVLEMNNAPGRKPGTPKTGGRQKGVPNKLTRTVKEAIEAAFEGVGGAQYLMEQAQQNPQAFMTLLGKIIPAQVQADLTNSDGSFKPAVIQIVAAQAKK